MTMNLTLKDDGGKVAASISAPPMLPDEQKIPDVSRDGAGLLLKYVLEAQGMRIPRRLLAISGRRQVVGVLRFHGRSS